MGLLPEFNDLDPLRAALLELMAFSFVYIRHECNDPKLCFAHADHMHNVPELIAKLDARRLRYYWEVERVCFLRNLSAINRKPPSPFEPLWEVIEREYHRLCLPPNE